jgi:hypothetical protein
MSALGQKRTFAAQNVMSALPPIATTKADFRKRSCLLMTQSGHVTRASLLRAISRHLRQRIAMPLLPQKRCDEPCLTC